MYSDMTDFQINIEVATCLGYDVANEITAGHLGFTQGFHENYPNTIWAQRDLSQPWEQFNFTCCPEDAWPVITENKIGLHPHDDGTYKAFTMVEGSDNYATETDSDNPLRAAMIEYLKINEYR